MSNFPSSSMAPPSPKIARVRSSASSRWRNFQQRGGLRHRLHAQIDAGKGAHRLAVVERIFQSFIGQPIPLLEEVNAPHPLDADRRTPPLPSWG